jgi:hypothetical protein
VDNACLCASGEYALHYSTALQPPTGTSFTQKEATRCHGLAPSVIHLEACHNERKAADMISVGGFSDDKDRTLLYLKARIG